MSERREEGGRRTEERGTDQLRTLQRADDLRLNRLDARLVRDRLELHPPPPSSNARGGGRSTLADQGRLPNHLEILQTRIRVALFPCCRFLRLAPESTDHRRPLQPQHMHLHPLPPPQAQPPLLLLTLINRLPLVPVPHKQLVVRLGVAPFCAGELGGFLARVGEESARGEGGGGEGEEGACGRGGWRGGGGRLGGRREEEGFEVRDTAGSRNTERWEGKQSQKRGKSKDRNRTGRTQPATSRLNTPPPSLPTP